MEKFKNFVTILAWVFLFTSFVRICFVLDVCRKGDPLIALADAYGHNPIGKALIQSSVVMVVCVAWLVARHFT